MQTLTPACVNVMHLCLSRVGPLANWLRPYVGQENNTARALSLISVQGCQMAERGQE